MTSQSPLDRLAGPGNVLSKEPPDANEFAGLSKCHDMRNRTEYEGTLDVDERLVADLITSCRKVAERVEGLMEASAEQRQLCRIHLA